MKIKLTKDLTNMQRYRLHEVVFPAGTILEVIDEEDDHWIVGGDEEAYLVMKDEAEEHKE